jgi:hypothetical protein
LSVQIIVRAPDIDAAKTLGLTCPISSDRAYLETTPLAASLQGVHWTVSLLKRWLLGTHAGAVKPKYRQADLDAFAFRFNQRKTKGVGRIAARTIEQLVARPTLTMKMLIRETVPCRAFRS